MWIEIDRESERTITRQIYGQIRRMILSGKLAAGEKLPSTRSVSSELSVSRNVVIEAYGQLVAEGYLETRTGSCTVVAQGLHAPDIGVPTERGYKRHREANRTAPDVVDFRTGIPALEYFPRKAWGKLYGDVLRGSPVSDFAYGEAAGVWELREAIAQYLYRARGVSCSPERIVVTSGSTQALSLVSRLLRDDRKVILTKNPSHAGLRKVMTLAGCRVEGVHADDRGLCTERLPPRRGVSFVCVTPSHQYPLGGVLPIRRRLELVRYAEQNDCYVVEDDYDSEFRYEGQPVGTLCELCPQRVIYFGSFSKILAPALRLGFMILPEKLLASCVRMKLYSDVHSDAFGQRVLARYIQSGSFEKHVRRLKKRYAEKRSHLLSELSKLCAGRFDVLGHATGLHLVVRFPGRKLTREMAGEIAALGVRVYRTGSFYLEKEEAPDDGIVLGYSHLSLDEITNGIEAICSVVFN